MDKIIDFLDFFNNTTLIASSLIMAMVFLFLPIPKNIGLKNYRISLRFLAMAYIMLAVLVAMIQLTGSKSHNLPIELAIISLQSILFAFSLTTLINNVIINTVFVVKHLLPTSFFIAAFILFTAIWDIPDLQSIKDMVDNFAHPTMMLVIVFTLFCVVQLIYLMRLFLTQEQLYKQKIDEYYADTSKIELRWVKYCFVSASVFAFTMLLGVLLSSPVIYLLTTVLNILFYVVFGLCYIQYPKTFISIEPVLTTLQDAMSAEPKLAAKIISWNELKTLVVTQNYYLQPNINIENMAQQLKIGRTTLSNYINKEEGMSFHSWIDSLRIEKAKHLIDSNQNYSIAQIANMVGYSEPSNFSRQFKQITNQTPTEWRREQSVRAPKE